MGRMMGLKLGETEGPMKLQQQEQKAQLWGLLERTEKRSGPMLAPHEDIVNLNQDVLCDDRSRSVVEQRQQKHSKLFHSQEGGMEDTADTGPP